MNVTRQEEAVRVKLFKTRRFGCIRLCVIIIIILTLQFDPQLASICMIFSLN